MGDRYKHNSDEILAVVDNLRAKIDDYKSSIGDLTSLITSIETSPSWKDERVKTSFINTCRSYIAIYKRLSFSMETYVKYLNSKSNSASAIDDAYIRG